MKNKTEMLATIAQLKGRGLSNPISLSVQIADQLEEILANGHIPVGQKLPTENELCDAFGVSRTVIREAVTQLKSLGLVETRRGIGTTVLRTVPVDSMASGRINLSTIDDILNVLKLRLNLEPAAAELAARYHDSNDRSILLNAHTAFIKARQGKSKAPDEDYNFHHAIVSASKNPFFISTYDHLGHSIIPRLKLKDADLDSDNMDQYLSRVEQDHMHILEAIVDRDPNRASDMMFQHIARARRTYEKYKEK